MRFAITAAACFMAALASSALAAGTSVFEVSLAADFNSGTFKGVTCIAPGGIRPGPVLSKVEIEESAVWSLLESGDTLYAGTAKSASVYRLRAGKCERILKTDGLLVSSMAMDAGGNLFAAVVPGGKIHRVPASGDPSVVIVPEPHVWALALDRDGHLLAATGPNAKLFRVEKGTGFVKEVFSSDREKNLVSLAVGNDGEIFCGSAENGILYQIRKDGSVSAVHDFTEKEVRSIAIIGNGLLVGTNAPKKGFDQVAFAGTLSDTLTSEGWGTGGRENALKKIAGAAVWTIEPDGKVSLRARFDGTFLLDVKPGADGEFFVATGDSGRVFSVNASGDVSTIIDLEEEQALSLAVRRGVPFAVGSGAPGFLFTVDSMRAGGGSWVSRVMDAGFPASFGNVEWNGKGNFEVRLRSGNTSEPDRTWSDWSFPMEKSGGKAPCPRGRFLQASVRFGEDPRSEFASLRVFFSPQNQRPEIKELTVGSAPQKDLYPLFKASRETSVKIKVRAEDPNGDVLIYGYSWNIEGTDDWVEMPGSPSDKPEMDWNTEGLADGNYRVKVRVSDGAFNSPGLITESISRFLTVDNTRPAVEGLVVVGGAVTQVRGVAADASSAITRIDCQVDDGPWSAVNPSDQVFDSLREPFSFTLPGLAPGRHRVTIRVWDRAGNTGVAFAWFDVP